MNDVIDEIIRSYSNAIYINPKHIQELIKKRYNISIDEISIQARIDRLIKS